MTNNTILTGKDFRHAVQSRNKFYQRFINKNPEKHCLHCHSETKLQRCSGCEQVYFCDRTCQRACWLIHRLDCK